MKLKLIAIAGLLASSTLLALGADGVPVNDKDTVVIFGDSITEQNMYAAFIETYLLSRFPKKDLTVYNFGWSGDTAPGGNSRFKRDVEPVKPTLVFVDFGMNDGGYRPFDQGIFDRYLGGQKALAESIKAAGAREVLVTTSPIDYDKRADKDVYNDTLSQMADGVIKLGKEIDVPVIDMFHAMREIQKQVKDKNPGFTMIPDAVHPDAVGHLIMAYLILKGVDAPHVIGNIVASPKELKSADGCKVENFKAAETSCEFDLTPPFIPFYVPPAARRALDFVPFQSDLNVFTLKVEQWDPEMSCGIVVDGKDTGSIFTSAQLAAGIDLSRVDEAPWSVQGRSLWEQAVFRWGRHYDAWRTMGLNAPENLRALPSFKTMIAGEKDFVRDLGASMKELAQPKTYHVSLVQRFDLQFSQVELSPLYPYKDEFDARLAPETEPDNVKWQWAPMTQNAIDFTQIFPNPTYCAVYARVILESDSDVKMHLTLGSDDGLKVIVNGKDVLSKNVTRGLHLGDDAADIDLVKGRNTLLFKVTQGGGGYGLAVAPKLESKAKVKQVLPAK